jgi:diguanylate cyclase (GGDEF)-like protein
MRSSAILVSVTSSSTASTAIGALLTLDLDRFKSVNDTRGHAIGDELLLSVGHRLRQCVRESDSVARMGGDEFVVLVEGLGSHEPSARNAAELVAEKVRLALAEPFPLGDPPVEHHGSSSIGMVLFQGAEVAQETLLKQADVALYKSKESGRNAVRLFNPGMQGHIDSRAAMELRLRRALPNNEFQLHLQPQVDEHGRVSGAEALLRWHPTDAKPVSPVEFIPLAEETGLIVPIGQWVLEQACETLAAWRDDPVLSPLRIAVNISARQFRQPDFVVGVRSALLRHHAPAQRLELELTESMLLDDVEQTVLRMRELREMGLAFSLDDFGTGYSSLAYLKRLPLNQLKIDRSFVRDISTDPNDAAIVSAITAMSHRLGLHVIAEGVETEAQRQYLIDCGCRTFQGWLYAPAMPAPKFETWVRERNVTTQAVPA